MAIQVPRRFRPDVAPWVLSALVAAGQVVVLSLVIAVGSPTVGYRGYGAYLFALGFGAVLLVRQRFPVTVLVVTVLGIFCYYTLDYPPVGMAVPTFVALYAAAERGRVGIAAVTGSVLLMVSLFFRALQGESSDVLAYDLITNAALVGCALALAMTVRGRRQVRDQQQRVVALERAKQEEQAMQRLQAERLRIARDLHDSVGHALTLLSVNAHVAREANDAEQATLSLDQVIEVTGATLRDLRGTLAVLRSADNSEMTRAPMSLDGIEQLTDSAREAGLDVDVDVGVSDADLPASTATAAFRIVQEAVTNVLRHAAAGGLTVSVRPDNGRLLVHVADDGAGAGVVDEGRGITGMRERAAALGGSLTVTTDESGRGAIVEASLPMGGHR